MSNIIFEKDFNWIHKYKIPGDIENILNDNQSVLNKDFLNELKLELDKSITNANTIQAYIVQCESILRKNISSRDEDYVKSIKNSLQKLLLLIKYNSPNKVLIVDQKTGMQGVNLIFKCSDYSDQAFIHLADTIHFALKNSNLVSSGLLSYRFEIGNNPKQLVFVSECANSKNVVMCNFLLSNKLADAGFINRQIKLI